MYGLARACVKDRVYGLVTAWDILGSTRICEGHFVINYRSPKLPNFAQVCFVNFILYRNSNDFML